MTRAMRDQIDISNVGTILDAVSKGYTRRTFTIPANLNRLGLRRDIDRAIAGYRSFVEISHKEPWQARADHGCRQIAQITDLINRLETGDEAAWWRDQMATRDHDGRPLPLLVVAALTEHRNHLRHLLRERLDADQVLGTPLGQHPAAELFGNDPESPLQWLVGERLAAIFERYFGRTATAGGTAHTVGMDGLDRSHGVGGPFIAFAMAVCEEAKIRVSAPSISSFLTRQRKRP